MPLSCGCDGEDFEWFFYTPEDYTKFSMTGRRKRCSCGDLIDHGAVCVEFKCFRNPSNDIEERIYGDGGEIHMASEWLCERCGDLYFSFVELGYECVTPEENMMELSKEYAELNGPVLVQHV